MMIYLFGLAAIYVAAYFHFYAEKPKVFVKPSSKLQRLLLKHVPVLNVPYYPTFWCPEGRMHTILRVFVPFNKEIEYKREVISSTDGGQFYVDWIENNSSVKFPDESTRPTVFIIPGLTSTSKSNYVLCMVDVLTQRGYRVMVIINRGLDGMPVLTPKPYCATHTMDLEVVIEKFKEKYPQAPLIAIGVSLGSLMIGRYLSMKKEAAKLTAVLLHSCPFSPHHGMENLETWENKFIFNTHLTRSLKNLYSRFHHLFVDIVDHEEVLSSKTIRDYDRSFTAKVFGYESVDAYYSDAFLTPEKLKMFTVPTLCVCAADDPFYPDYGSALPKKEIALTENVALVVTKGGGHVGHMEGWNPRAKTYFEKIMEQFISGIVSERGKL